MLDPGRQPHPKVPTSPFTTPCYAPCAADIGCPSGSSQSMTSAPSSDFGAYVHPDEARMAAWLRVYERYLIVEDIYPTLAGQVLAHGGRRFVEVGGGRGPMARILSELGVATLVVDLDDQMLAETHGPAVKADLGWLPLADVSVDAVAAVNCLYL